MAVLEGREERERGDGQLASLQCILVLMVDIAD
jgi:hypothetical protein